MALNKVGPQPSTQPTQSPATSRTRAPAAPATSGGEKAKQGAPADGSAEAEISTRAKDAGKAFKAAKDAPEVREAKIAELKRRIANREYNVAPEAVADRMVDEHLKASV